MAHTCLDSVCLSTALMVCLAAVCADCAAFCPGRTHPFTHVAVKHLHTCTCNTTTTTTTTAAATLIQDNAETTKNVEALFESNGDYRAEAWIENANLPLYAEQQSLPHLPVPSLEETIQTFLPTALPLATSEEEASSLREACQKFPEQAAKLQSRLLQRQAEYKDSSWLQQWWNQNVYLRWREPNAMHVSYFFQLPDDPSLPTDHYNHNKSNKRENTKKIASDNSNALGLARAASALQAVALYAQIVVDGTHPADKIGKRGKEQALCSSQFKMLFGACRIPKPQQDAYRVYDINNKPLHAVVAVKGHFYAIPLTSDEIAENGKENSNMASLHPVLSRSALQNLLQQCVNHEVPDIPELGYLTTGHRDEWAAVYSMFLKTPEMSNALNKLQSALCMISLDFDNGNEGQLLSERDFGLRLWHGNFVHSANRWYDKSIQLVVSQQGNMGLIGEHSMADGMPAMGLCSYLRKRADLNYEDVPNQTPIHPVEHENISLSSAVKASPVPIFASAFRGAPKDIQRELESHVEEAKKKFFERIEKHDLNCLFYSKYGKKNIKSFGYSPDAYVQTAMQLAGSRLYNNGQKLVGVYEATQTRKFRHGRTETTRSVSPECDEFCKAMNAAYKVDHTNVKEYSDEEKIELLHKACKTHHAYTVKAVDGKGVDRHFFGLQMCIQDGDQTPDLFSNALFQRSKKWLLSTSTVPGCAPGFGNVEPDGVGLGYEILDDSCIFAITAEKRTECAEKLGKYLEEALDEMAKLHQKQDSLDSSTVSKL